jgi:hypothetical protein
MDMALIGVIRRYLANYHGGAVRDSREKIIAIQ